MLFSILDPPRIQKSPPDGPPWKPRPLGPCPDDIAKLIESPERPPWSKGPLGKNGVKPFRTKIEISLKFSVVWAGNPRDFSGLFKGSICNYRELRRLKSNQFHLSFSCVFSICAPPVIQKSTPNDAPWKPFPLGPCPDDRAQNSMQDSLESSVRPNPTLVFSKILFQFYRLWPP